MNTTPSRPTRPSIAVKSWIVVMLAADDRDERGREHDLADERHRDPAVELSCPVSTQRNSVRRYDQSSLRGMPSAP